MQERVQARVTQRFSAAPERVFDAWLAPQSVRVWMAAALRAMGLSGDLTEVRIDARVGGGFTFADRRGDVEARHWGTYRTLERPHRLVFTWITDASEEADPSLVTITIAAREGGCELELVHEMSAEWRDYVQRTEQGWTRMLEAIGGGL